MAAISNDWKEALNPEFSKPYYKKLYDTLKKEYKTQVIYPDTKDLFNAFDLTPLSEVKVVIIGQDPYHEPGQAHGLCFSVRDGVDIPPSLKNIYKELNDDLGLKVPNNGNLTKWARQGVLLLNNVLTVRAHRAYSHKDIGWEQFTDAVIEVLNKTDRPIVFMLWGKPAQTKGEKLNNRNHLILKAPHPSPLSAHRGFLGCRHFSRANEFLAEKGLTPIDWQIDDI
ncbi:MAG: uracil-DNA glycosylase [Lachnospiraceae bacterium]|nr:uracil-DNA glycosylase [Lachnospiraceae bacterium]